MRGITSVTPVEGERKEMVCIAKTRFKRSRNTLFVRKMLLSHKNGIT